MGAVLGDMWRKDESKAYMHVMLADGTGSIISAPGKDHMVLQQFARAINKASGLPQEG